MRSPLKCPACGAGADDDRIGVVQPYKAAGVGHVVGQADDGSLLVEWVDRGDPFRFYQVELECGCGHHWPTTRTIVAADTATP